MAELGPVEIVRRSEWGAVPPTGECDYLQPPVTHVVVSFDSDTNRDTDQELCMESMRSLQVLHMHTYGYTDIGYNFVIGGDLRVYEGRGWHDTPRNPDRARHIEEHSLNIALMGTLDREDLPFDMYKKYLELIKQGVEESYISPRYDVIDEPETLEEDDKQIDGFKRFNLQKVIDQYGDEVLPLLDDESDDLDEDGMEDKEASEVNEGEVKPDADEDGVQPSADRDDYEYDTDRDEYEYDSDEGENDDDDYKADESLDEEKPEYDEDEYYDYNPFSLREYNLKERNRQPTTKVVVNIPNNNPSDDEPVDIDYYFGDEYMNGSMEVCKELKELKELERLEKRKRRKELKKTSYELNESVMNEF